MPRVVNTPVDAEPPPLPASAFDEYEGQWILINDGDVLASGDELVHVLSSVAVPASAAAFHVPAHDEHV